MKRMSPVRMPLEADKTEVRNHFEVVLAYGGETSGPSLVDLSHLSKWEIDGANPDEQLKKMGLTLPGKPGQAFLSDEKAVCRLTPTRALIWDFRDGEGDAWKEAKVSNDLTDGSALFFMTGEALLSIMERLTELDLKFKKDSNLLFLQGPVVGIPAKILLGMNQKHQTGMFISVGRGFGQSLVDAILSAGEEADISPAGENIFFRWLST